MFTIDTTQVHVSSAAIDLVQEGFEVWKRSMILPQSRTATKSCLQHLTPQGSCDHRDHSPQNEQGRPLQAGLGSGGGDRRSRPTSEPVTFGL